MKAYLEQHSRGDGAETQLLVAQTFVETGSKEQARTAAEVALSFFEPRGVWESVARGKAILVRSAGADSSQRYVSECRAAIEKLRAEWDSASLAGYLKRPDVRRLIGGLGVG
jgi:hypothetical protein